LWNDTFGGTGSDWGQSIAIAQNGDVGITGMYGAAFDFDDPANVLNATGGIFVAVFLEASLEPAATTGVPVTAEPSSGSTSIVLNFQIKEMVMMLLAVFLGFALL